MNLGILITKSYSEFITNNYSEFSLVDNRVTSTGNDFVQILIMLGAFGVVIGIMYSALKLMLGNSMDKAEAKKKIVFETILAIVLFSITSLAIILYKYVISIKF